MRIRSRGYLIFLSVIYGLLGLVFVSGSVSSLLLVSNEPEPLRISLADYLRTRPTNRWLELTDCSVWIRGATYHKQVVGGSLLDAAVPVYPTGQSRGPVQVVLSMPANQVITANAPAIEIGQTLSGMVKSGMFYTGLDHDLQAAASWTLADDYIILEQGKSPNSGMAIGGLIAGLICLGSVARTLWQPVAKVPHGDAPRILLGIEAEKRRVLN